VLQNTSRENVNVNCFGFFFISIFLMDVTGGKITINLKEIRKIEKEKTHVHWKRARSAQSRERMLDMRQYCTISWGCSVRLNKGRKSELS